MKSILAQLDGIVAPDAILATNTSSLPVTEIAVGTGNPKRVVGMHFFNPAPVLQFVEVIKTVVTADDVLRMSRRPRSGWRRSPSSGTGLGRIANALLFGYLNHAVSMYEKGTPRARTWMRPCASGAAIPWGRLPCST